jgi:hypothetical protein
MIHVAPNTSTEWDAVAKRIINLFEESGSGALISTGVQIV